MTTEYINIVPAQILPVGQLAVYTATATTLIDAFSMTNISPGDVVVDVYLVLDGMSASEENRVIKNHILAANETYVFYQIMGHTLNANAFIVCETDTNAAVNVNISGRVITDT